MYGRNPGGSQSPNNRVGWLGCIEETEGAGCLSHADGGKMMWSSLVTRSIYKTKKPIRRWRVQNWPGEKKVGLALQEIGNRGEYPLVWRLVTCQGSGIAFIDHSEAETRCCPSPESRGNRTREGEWLTEGVKEESHGPWIQGQVCLYSPHLKYYLLPKYPSLCSPVLPRPLRTGW